MTINLRVPSKSLLDSKVLTSDTDVEFKHFV